MTLADGSVHEGEYRGGIKLRRTTVIVIFRRYIGHWNETDTDGISCAICLDDFSSGQKG